MLLFLLLFCFFCGRSFCCVLFPFFSSQCFLCTSSIHNNNSSNCKGCFFPLSVSCCVLFLCVACRQACYFVDGKWRLMISDQTYIYRYYIKTTKFFACCLKSLRMVFDRINAKSISIAFAYYDHISATTDYDSIAPAEELRLFKEFREIHQHQPYFNMQNPLLSLGKEAKSVGRPIRNRRNRFASTRIGKCRSCKNMLRENAWRSRVYAKLHEAEYERGCPTRTPVVVSEI